MEQLSKPFPTNNNGELSVNVQLSNQNVKNIHEALVFYLHSTNKKNNESTYLQIKDLREQVLKLRKVMNPS